MFLSVKEAASGTGLVLVGGVGILLAVAPILDQRGRLTLEHSFWIALAMTVLSFVCFAVEKVLNSRDEEARKKQDKERREREAERDRLINDMAEEQKEMRKAQSAFSAEQAKQLELARYTLTILAKTKDLPAQQAGVSIRDAMQTIAPTLGGAGVTTLYKWTDVTDQLAASEKFRSDLRYAADKLVRSALNIPEKKDNETPY
jgi:heme exporter protein D